MPGMPVPAAGSNAASNPVDATGGLRATASGGGAASNAGRGTAVLDAEDFEGPGLQVEGPRAGEAPPPPESAAADSHVVRKGETLWDISATFLHSPWSWPKLWSYNPLVTNPHWIYPGDVLRLSPMASAQAAAMPAATTATAAPAQPAQPLSHFEVVTRAGQAGLSLQQTGFVDQGELRAAGKVVGSREEREMLATLDEAYVQYSDDQPLEVGKRYSVYRVIKDLRRPGSATVLGHVVEIRGQVEVRSLGGKNIAKAVIIEALNSIERGDRVGPLRREFKMVEPVQNRENLDAVVLATLAPVDLVGEAMLVFIDRGRDDGVEVGNRFAVVQRGDGYQTLLTDRPPNDPRFPREVLGDVLVVDVRSRVATGVVMRSIKELRVGQKVEARKGY
jgi:nucleoid-associated protein YgaU